jgi:hypothetical protein
MDECRFDNWTRMLGALQDRRAAVKELAAAGAALVAPARADLGLAQEGDVIAEGCRGGGVSCRRNNQCCSGKCNRKRRKKRNRNDRDKKGRRRDDGVCKCLGNGKSCRKDAACCKGRCDPDSRRCRCIPRNDLCEQDGDCCGRAVCRSDGARKVCQNKGRKK